MSSLVVADASLALKWVLVERDSLDALALLNKWTNDGVRVIAPALFVYEVTNTFYQHARSSKLAYDEARQALTDLFSIGVSLKLTFYKEISKQALEYAHQFALPATYDAHYLALAQKERCEYWTADTRLWNGVKGKLSWVHWFGDYVNS